MENMAPDDPPISFSETCPIVLKPFSIFYVCAIDTT
jgi:hypothetical protein